jgi:hypothetical protein
LNRSFKTEFAQRIIARNDYLKREGAGEHVEEVTEEEENDTEAGEIGVLKCKRLLQHFSNRPNVSNDQNILAEVAPSHQMLLQRCPSPELSDHLVEPTNFQVYSEQVNHNKTLAYGADNMNMNFSTAIKTRHEFTYLFSTSARNNPKQNPPAMINEKSKKANFQQ